MIKFAANRLFAYFCNVIKHHTPLEQDTHISRLLAQMQPITLEQMKDIRLMNRLDTKFVTNEERLVELLARVQDDYFVQETGGLRACPYQTTYLDTPAHRFYLMHHNGHLNRTKVRVRTYLSSGGLTFLEVKRKNNHGRTRKKRLPVPSLDACATAEGALELVRDNAGLELSDLHPVVRNRFDRITLVNRGKTERLTIDFNVCFHNLESGHDGLTGRLVIIELKRDGNVYSPIRNILRDLHIHPTGFSKCCIGMALTDPALKQNRFKPKMRLLQKIEGRGGLTLSDKAPLPPTSPDS